MFTLITMSKRQDAYLAGLERLYNYLMIFLQEESIPTCDQIEAERHAIASLRSLPFSIHISRDIDPADGYYVLFGEEYRRYDDILPEALNLYILPNAMDVPKERNRFITSQVKPQ